MYIYIFTTTHIVNIHKLFINAKKKILLRQCFFVNTNNRDNLLECTDALLNAK
jgi:hypothetical protein